MAEFYSKAIDMKMEEVNSESWLSIGPERRIIFTSFAYLYAHIIDY